MNSKKIEMNSILKLRTDLERCDRISTEIPDNDRTPSWDGAIFMYNTTTLEKENIQGKIHVQVKGKVVIKEKLAKQQISYPVEVADLKNFRGVGGTIFFVVYMADYDHYKIYYNSLLPLDLEEILRNTAVKQKTKSIKLNEFPTNDLTMVILILSNFIKDSRKQHSTAKTGNDLKFAEYDSLSFSASGSRHNMFEYMFKLPTYIYGRKKGFDIDIPLIKVTLESINNDVNMPVTIDNIVFYEQISVEKGHNTLKIKIGAGFTIDVNKKKLDYIQNGSLEERIQDLQFFIGLLKGKILKIGNVLESDNVKMTGCNLKQMKKTLLFYNNLQNFISCLNITDKLDLDKMSEDDYYEIEILQKAIMDKIPVNVNEKNEDVFLGKYRISNLVIAVWAEKVSDGKYTINNLFDKECRQCIMKNNNMEELPSCIYTLLKKDDFIELSNVCYENMIKELLSVSYSREYGITVNFLLLEMLFAFDEKKERDNELIDNIITIAKWLTCQETGNSLFILNYLQSIKRTRNLDMEEFNMLQKLKEDEIKNSYNLAVLSGISILLENKTDLEYYLGKMGQEERASFMKYPIYTLTPR